MKQKLIASLIVLYCISVLIFHQFGEEFRSLMSPHVTFSDVLYSVDSYVVPEKSLRSDKNGTDYVLLIRKTDIFPEKGYEAIRKDCRINMVKDGMAFIEFYDRISLNEKVIVTSDRPVCDGYKIIIK